METAAVADPPACRSCDCGVTVHDYLLAQDPTLLCLLLCYAARPALVCSLATDLNQFIL